MNKENKYYTPDISEFYSGFEYEYLDQNKKNPIWIKSNEFSNDWVYDDNPHYAVSRNIKEGNIRVKYLDQEDIESLGFKLNDSYKEEFVFNYDLKPVDNGYKFGIRLHFFGIRLIICDNLDFGFNKERTYFDGIIKNISELKILLKQLNIN
jgi:hypothetical protein